ncbi:MAG: glycoside hydrolase family 9 protein [Candidatus Latescibacteria bacterium]|nr:glycoside hydrolase family 9 protein [Candidatus Latescibacterota bacterium]
MKKMCVTFCFLGMMFFAAEIISAESWIRVNQLGYLPGSIKNAVLVSKDTNSVSGFELCDALTDEVVYTSDNIKQFGSYAAFSHGYRLDFSDFKKRGAYYVKAGTAQSPHFRIATDVYDGTADFLLNYMRQQRCGYNPCLRDSCHVHDGYIIYHPTLDSTYIDVTGGWHDASDYLQYVTTSANATFQMLFAWQQNPGSFGDSYDATGLPGANGIPDILDEAKWGLDWLVKMNPRKDFMFNQIADDRDHSGFRLPNSDSTSYGKGLERPVYFCTGKPQGLFEHKNRANGIASTAGKYASAFALGSQVLRDYYPEFAETIEQKAVDAYDYGVRNPGVCQTAPCLAPYFYEEDNWVDDMELAAYQLYELTGNRKYLGEASQYGKQEQFTPWMGSEKARHYQWYPFVNLGHYFCAKSEDSNDSREFVSYLKKGIDNVWQRGKDNPFLMGVPFIWCSNNLVAALITQCRLYREVTGDTAYAEMEASMRDWLFGCNPWGTSMIVGLPKYGDYPDDTHSSLAAVYNIQVWGGLVDGPVYGSVFDSLIGLTLYNGDEYADFQSDLVVYHDDYGDYSTNEPTMDGTASLTYYLSSMQKDGMNARVDRNLVFDYGGVVRTDPTMKEINLVFTAHGFVDGYETIRSVLNKHGIKAGFFFTGDFYRTPEFARMVHALKADGMYIGAHSDKHILYAPWENRDSTLVSKDEFLTDLKGNYAEMAKFGITKKDAPYYMPPYEWYNDEISDWCKEYGLILINLTPNTWVNQDWTVPVPEGPYYSSDELLGKLKNFEINDEHGLNGTILLIHFGTDPRRTDKLYNRLDSLITELKGKGYRFTSLRETIR